MTLEKSRGLWGPEDCELFVGCKAPLCPMDADAEKGLWYPDEPICRSEKFQDLVWVARQRDVHKLLGRKSETLFTPQMLRSIKTVEPGLEGADPSDRNAEKHWLDKHKKQTKTVKKGRRLMGTQQKGVSVNTMLVAIDYEGSSGTIFQKIMNALEGNSGVKEIKLFKEPRTASVPKRQKSATPKASKKVTEKTIEPHKVGGDTDVSKKVTRSGKGKAMTLDL